MKRFVQVYPNHVNSNHMSQSSQQRGQICKAIVVRSNLLQKSCIKHEELRCMQSPCDCSLLVRFVCVRSHGVHQGKSY